MPTTLLNLTATNFVGDDDAQLVAGDAACSLEFHKGRAALTFDPGGTAEAAITGEYVMPSEYAAGTLKADIILAADTATTGGVVFDVFVEAKTPGTDTFDMETDTGWDSANSSGDIDLAGTTAGDPLKATITLTNKDSVAAGDTVRFGIRRDTDHAGDDASGDAFVYAVRIFED